MFTRAQFAEALAKRVGNPSPSPAVIDFIVGWSKYETNTNSGALYNILNTTQPASDATQFNKVGVENYTSFEEGINETAITLENGFYPALLTAIRTNDVTALSAPNPAVLANLKTWSGGTPYGAGFIASGAASLNDPFNYGSAPTPPAAPPAPPAKPTYYQQIAADEEWDCLLEDDPQGPAPKATGIYQQWLANYIQGRFFGPPVGHERNSVNWQGKSVIKQQFLYAHVEWSNGLLGWYLPPKN